MANNHRFGTVTQLGKNFLSDIGVDYGGTIQSIEYFASIGELGELKINGIIRYVVKRYLVRSPLWDELLIAVGHDQFCRDMPIKSIRVSMCLDDAAEVVIQSIAIDPRSVDKENDKPDRKGVIRAISRWLYF